jgi:hypothetical protein
MNIVARIAGLRTTKRCNRITVDIIQSGQRLYAPGCGSGPTETLWWFASLKLMGWLAALNADSYGNRPNRPLLAWKIRGFRTAIVWRPGISPFICRAGVRPRILQHGGSTRATGATKKNVTPPTKRRRATALSPMRRHICNCISCAGSSAGTALISRMPVLSAMISAGTPNGRYSPLSIPGIPTPRRTRMLARSKARQSSGVKRFQQSRTGMPT